MADYDRRELTDDISILLRASNKGLQSGIWTAVPGIISSFDAVKMTCEVQPAVKSQVLSRDGTSTWAQLPLLVDCPVVFPSGGGFTLTFPVKKGDEVLVVFASRCIDSWWQSGGVQVQAELRMHDLSDGFALPGPFSQPRVVPGVSTTDVQLRNDSGTAYVGIKPTGEIDVHTAGNIIVDAEGVANVTAPNVNLFGNVTISGNLVVSGTSEALDFVTPLLPSYNAHLHPGIRIGTDNTREPIPGT